MTNGTDYRAILASDTPLIDVRAPVEFSQSAMPAAINLPLMNDEERAAVGTCYKRQGPEAALALGHKLVQGDLGGYKALRQAAIQATDELVQRPIVLIGGCTGNGKTQLVCSRPDGIDLEGLAHHRGSSFGRTLQDQHPQATFENHLAVSLLKKAEQQTRWVLEDEGHMIGANHLPESLRLRMAQSPLAVVEDPFDVRLERLREEYFDRMYRDFIAAYGEEKGWQAYGEYLHHGLFAIRRRLGLQRFAQLTERLDEALVQQQRTASTEAHFAWLVPLLEEYYDPMYRYQLGKKAGKILFRGSWQEVAAWLAK